MSEEKLKTYVVTVGPVYMEVLAEGVDEEDAIYAVKEGFYTHELKNFDDADYEAIEYDI